MATPRFSFAWIRRILQKFWKPETTKPKTHVQLVEQALHQVQGMTSEGSKIQFHHEQCRHLVHKLEMVVTLIRSKVLYTTLLFLCLRRRAENFRKACRLLYQLVNEAESFILNCCKNEWIQTAVILTDVSKHVATRAFHFELLMLRLHKILGRPSLTLERAELENLYADEFNKVQATASVDRGNLVDRLEKVIHDSSIPKNEQFLLATYVLQRLQCPKGQPDSSHWEVDLGSLQHKETLVDGGRGIVVEKIIWLGAEVAARTFYGQHLYRIFQKEVSILQRLSHPNIVPLLCYATNEHKHSIVMELMDSDLRVLIEHRFQSARNCKVPFTMEESVDIILQVAEAMSHIHERRILHRDLKSENILVTYAKGKGVLHVKVADFGISKVQEHSSTFSCQSLNKGSTRWMAPEVMAQARSGSEEVLKYPFKSDIYSFGMLCYEILTGNEPFRNIESLHKVRDKVLCGERPELPQMCPVDLKTLIVRCWQSKASARPSFTEICRELQYIHSCIFLGFFEQDQEKVADRRRQKYKAGGEARSGFKPYAALFSMDCTLGHPDDDPDDPRFWSMILEEDISTLKLKRRLGRGGSDNANVFLSTWLHDSNVQDVAQKIFPVRSVVSASFENELSIMAKLNHPNIVRLLDCVEDGRTQSIVMELMDGDLNDLSRKRLAEDTTREVPFSMNEAVDMMLQIAEAMNYLHRNKIVHQDLKSDNILFRNVMEGTWIMKVADFGLSKDLGSDNKRGRSCERAPHGEDVSNVATYTGNVGTIRWMAPELMSIHGNEDEAVADASHDPYKSDIYSFAMVCSEILTGHVPFSDIQDPSEVCTKVVEGERPMLPNQCPPKLKALIGHCWHPQASLRPTFDKIAQELNSISLEQRNDHV